MHGHESEATAKTFYDSVTVDMLYDSLTSIYYGVCFGVLLFGLRLILGAWIVTA
ncbi:hypothetical protein SBF1_6340001 [Candidatus Desulfosporosinus infrequens]|uniref:Uncharacterized protein n=1 Tax=Candidatus Desulfosporosinus infrequens TaxID=2043169 RepID=A0A2U3LMN9_9FIRM|nr:hypothetical protein SBF1_6340001 [Candidatus Desulfosporosinus infrequens]